jgi:predicted nucleic acid-binding protein
MRILIDTNVALDWLLERRPWFAEAEALWRLLSEGGVAGYILATTLTDIFYIARRLAGLEAARTAVRESLAALVILPVDRTALEDALALPGNDFEDNLQIVCAHAAGLDAIVTRDPAGFLAAAIPVLAPTEAVERLRTGGNG